MGNNSRTLKFPAFPHRIRAQFPLSNAQDALRHQMHRPKDAQRGLQDASSLPDAQERGLRRCILPTLLASHTRATTRRPPATTRVPPPAHHPHATGGRGSTCGCAADVLIHPPVPKKKAKWRIRGCGATRSSPRPPSLGSHVVRP